MPILTEANRKWWTLGAMCFALFMVMLDNTVVNIALPAIKSDFGASISGLSWAVNAYTLSFAVLLVTGGRLGDVFGRKRMFLAGLVAFTLGRSAPGSRSSISQLIFFRAAQGAGAAFLMPGSLSILTDAFHGRSAGRALGLWAGISGMALGMGPVLGGLLVEKAGWEWIFFLNVPVALIAVPRDPLRRARVARPVGGAPDRLGSASARCRSGSAARRAGARAGQRRTAGRRPARSPSTPSARPAWSRSAGSSSPADDPMLDLGFFQQPHVQRGQPGRVPGHATRCSRRSSSSRSTCRTSCASRRSRPACASCR